MTAAIWYHDRTVVVDTTTVPPTGATVDPDGHGTHLDPEDAVAAVEKLLGDRKSGV